jgi:hypothetical protein
MLMTYLHALQFFWLEQVEGLRITLSSSDFGGNAFDGDLVVMNHSLRVSPMRLN